MATIKTASGKTFKVAKGVDGKPRVTPAKWAKGEIKQMQGLISSIHLTQRPLGGGPRAEEEFGDRFRTVRTLSDRKWVESTLEGNAAEARRRADEDEKTATHYRMTFPTQTDVQERFARSAAENRKGAEETERLLSKVRAHGLPVEVRAYDPTLPERDRAARVAEASAGKWQPPDEREALRKVARWEREGASAKISRTREQRQWRDGGDFDYERHQRSMADVAKRMRESGRYSEEQIAARMKAFPHMFDYRNAAVLAHVVSQQAAIGQSIGEFVAGGAKWRPVASIGRADYQERVEGRKERLEARAEKLQAEAERRFAGVSRIADHIPLGQPILVGHHSERHARADQERIRTGMKKGIEAERAAKQLASRAASVGTAGISSDDPEAVRLLKEKLAKAERIQSTMTAANAAIRKHAKAGKDAQVAALVALGHPESRARQLLEPDFAGRIGFADYQTKNNGAEIRRIKERIASLEKEGERRAVTPAASGTFKGGSWEERPDINRVAVTFDGKPDEGTRAKLKGLGFRWSPTEGAWVTGLDNRGRYRVKEVERMMGAAEAPTTAPTGPTRESAAAERAAASAAVQGASDKTARMKAGLAAMMLAAQQGQVGAALGAAMAGAAKAETGKPEDRRLATFRSGVAAHDAKFKALGEESNDYNRMIHGMAAVMRAAGVNVTPSDVASRWHEPLASATPEYLADPYARRHGWPSMAQQMEAVAKRTVGGADRESDRRYSGEWRLDKAESSVRGIGDERAIAAEADAMIRAEIKRKHPDLRANTKKWKDLYASVEDKAREIVKQQKIADAERQLREAAQHVRLSGGGQYDQGVAKEVNAMIGGARGLRRDAEMLAAVLPESEVPAQLRARADEIEAKAKEREAYAVGRYDAAAAAIAAAKGEAAPRSIGMALSAERERLASSRDADAKSKEVGRTRAGIAAMLLAVQQAAPAPQTTPPAPKPLGPVLRGIGATVDPSKVQTGAPQVTKTDARKVDSLAARNDKLKALPPGVAESVRKYLKAGFAPHKAMARALVENVKVQRGPRGGLFYMTEGGNKKYIRRGTAMSAAVDRSKVG